MLRVDALETAYGQSQVLFGVSFAIEAGQVVTLLGRNGMGKTTTVLSIMGVVHARRGVVTIDGKALTGLPSYRVAQAGLGLVPEGRQIFPNLSVRENLVATAANRHGAATPWTLDRVYGMFSALAERKNHFGNQLSGGEQQMLAIGRALMTNPRLLILDEATEGLAPLIREDIYRAIDRLKGEGLAILMIDKGLKALAAVADMHYVLEKGRVVWSGDSAALRSSEDMQHRYLGV